MTADSLNVTLLGKMKFHIGDAERPLPPTQKTQSLLAYLVCHRQTAVPRARLTGMFWGDRPDKRARRSLSTALWHIRRCFAPVDPILADNQTTRFVCPGELWLDIEAFTQAAQSSDLTVLETAVSLYHGDFLDGFYDDWVINERYRLQSLYLDTLARLIRLYDTAVRPNHVLQTALTLLQHDPLREEAHRAAIHAFAQLGRRSHALRQFDQCRQILADELGVAPAPETAALRQAVLDGQIELVSGDLFPPSTPHLPTPISQPPSPIPYPFQFPLTEREPALAELAAAWEEVRRGNGRFCFIQGEPGIGKSRLLAEFSATIRQQGGQVLSGACYEFERLLPYQPFADALRPALARLRPADRAALPNWLRTELSHLLPDWEPDAPLAEASHPDTLFHAVVRFLVRLGQAAPVLLLIDDLHWANEATLSLLHYLARHGRAASLLILCAHRETMPASLADLRQTLAQAGLATALDLSRLSVNGVRELLRPLLPQADALADFLFVETAGNPFFLVEMLKSLGENGFLTRQNDHWQADLARLTAVPLPDSIKTAVAQRLQRLSSEAQTVAGITAVLGRACQYDLLRAVWMEDEDQMLAGLDDLLRANLMQEGDEWDYAFTHHKIQEAIYDDLPRHRRLHLHAQAGRALLAQDAAQPAELAHHLAQGIQVDLSLAVPASTALCRAGTQAAGLFAYADALAFFQQALDLEPETAVHQKILLAREAVYHAQGAREAQARDLAALESLPAVDEETANQIRLRRARFSQLTGDIETAVTLIQQILAAGTPIQQARANILQGEIARKQADYAAAVTAIKRALPHIKGHPAIHAQARLELGTTYLALNQFAEAAREHRQGRDLYRQLADRRGEAYALNNLGAVLMGQEQYQEAVPVFAEARGMFVEIGDRRGEGLSSANLGMIGMHRGDGETAQRELERAGGLFVVVGDENSAAHLWLALGNLLFNQGQLAGAQQFTQQAVTAAERLNARHTLAQGANNLGFIAAMVGRFQEAQEFYHQSLVVKQEIGDASGRCTTLLNLAQACRGLGDGEAALMHGREALKIARRLENDDLMVESLWTIGFALHDLGQLAKAKTFFLESLPMAGQRKPYVLAGLASVILAQGDVATAVAHITPCLPDLAEAPLEMPEKFEAFAIGCRVLAANGEMDKAETWRETAVALLEESAARIEDKTLRYSFLEEVPVHKLLRDHKHIPQDT